MIELYFVIFKTENKKFIRGSFESFEEAEDYLEDCCVGTEYTEKDFYIEKIKVNKGVKYEDLRSRIF